MITHCNLSKHSLCYEQLLFLSDFFLKSNFQKFKTEGLASFNTVFFLTQNYSEDFLSNTLPQQIHSPQEGAAF